jgi:hypothetical protein
MEQPAMNSTTLWQRYQQHLCRVPELELTLDISRMRFEDGFLQRMAAPMQGTDGRAGCPRPDNLPRK